MMVFFRAARTPNKNVYVRSQSLSPPSKFCTVVRPSQKKAFDAGRTGGIGMVLRLDD